MDKKLTVAETAQYLGVSKEAIYNRLRRGTLNSILENGKKYILITSKEQIREPKRANMGKKMNIEYIELLKVQLEELKIRNTKLEEDKDKLQHEKEKLLVDSKQMIEEVYKERDEQLRAILSLINAPTIGHKLESNEEIEVIEELVIQEDIVDQICESFEDWELLDARLDRKKLKGSKRKKRVKQIKRRVGSSSHVKISSGDIYIKKDKKLKKIIGEK